MNELKDELESSHDTIMDQVGGGGNKGFSVGVMQAQPIIDRLYTTNTIHLTRNDVPTLFTSSSASKSPSKSTHNPPKPSVFKTLGFVHPSVLITPVVGQAANHISDQVSGHAKLNI